MGRRRAGGVDSDGVAAGAGHPEPVGRIVRVLVGHPGHGADRRFNAEPRSNAASKLWRPANGPLRRRLSPRRSMAPCGADLPDVIRGAAINAAYFCGPVRGGVCPLQVQGMSRGPALPKGIWARPGITGLLGTGPRAMPLRAAPGESSGPRRVQSEPSAVLDRSGARRTSCRVRGGGRKYPRVHAGG
jgi:hypothetical protein